MPKISNIEILSLRKQKILSVRNYSDISNLPSLIGESFKKITDYLNEIGEFTSDVPFVAFHDANPENLDVEIGFPVPKHLPGKNEIKSSFIPESLAIVSMFRGSNTDMDSLYEEMIEWIENSTYKLAGVVYEYYYNGIEFPEDELLTKIVMPIKE